MLSSFQLVRLVCEQKYNVQILREGMMMITCVCVLLCRGNIIKLVKERRMNSGNNGEEKEEEEKHVSFFSQY